MRVLYVFSEMLFYVCAAIAVYELHIVYPWIACAFGGFIFYAGCKGWLQ